MKISFDYDGVLSTGRGKLLATKTINAGNEVYIITGRQKKDSAPVYYLADQLGIPVNRVFFTEGKDKYPFIDELGINLHYDDNKEQVDLINARTKAAAILF
jgi:hypothetical protein